MTHKLYINDICFDFHLIDHQVVYINDVMSFHETKSIIKGKYKEIKFELSIPRELIHVDVGATIDKVDFHILVADDSNNFKKHRLIEKLIEKNLLDRKLLTEIKLSDTDLYNQVIDVFNLDLEATQ